MYHWINLAYNYLTFLESSNILLLDASFNELNLRIRLFYLEHNEIEEKYMRILRNILEDRFGKIKISLRWLTNQYENISLLKPNNQRDYLDRLPISKG